MSNSALDDTQLDLAIIGGGVIGLALARQAALDYPTRNIALIEQKKKCGMGISSRSSEVIHAGLYYPRTYLKTTLCVNGNRQLYEYCASHNIAHRRLGKIIVASSDEEHEFLHALALRAEFNGVADLKWLTRTTLAELEPALDVKGAILSPSTGIIDSTQLLNVLEKEARDAGVHLLLHTRVVDITRSAKSLILGCRSANDKAAYRCQARVVINAAGLQALSLAKTIADFPEQVLPRVALAKGDYFSYAAKNPFRHLIYPVPSGQPMSSPNAQHTGLGIHATLDLQNNLRFGPDLSFVDQETYNVDETRRDEFAETIRRYFPALDADKLNPAYAGIRPRLLNDNSRTPDFIIQTEQQHSVSGLINLFGIESPGLTCCLSLAESLSAQLQNILG